MRAIKEGVCGTTACAAGYAGLIPEFRRDGFKLVEESYGDWNIVYYLENGQSLNGFSACSAFFMLTPSQTKLIFNPDSYFSNRQSKYYVIKRIKKQIALMERVLKERESENA